LDTLEGSVQWLVNAVDREKQEKEWLANKYDEKCEEVRAMQQEIAGLRAELSNQRSTAAAEMQRPALRGMAPGVVEKAPGDNAVFATANRTSNSSSSSTEPPGVTSPGTSPTGMSRLKERRGLKLSIETNNQGRSKLTKESVVSPVREEAEETEIRREVSTEVVRRESSSNINHEGSEPMSALLRRRAEDWTPIRMPAADSSANTGKIGNLRVAADKVESLGEDCPMSPKRARNRKTGNNEVSGSRTMPNPSKFQSEP